MERPLEIAFHGVQPSSAIEAEIRKHVDKLAKRSSQLIGCRVSVEALHRQHQTGNVYEVHIVMSVPGRDLAVSREPQKPKERYANPTLQSTVRDAFKAAERQLLAYKQQLREEIATPNGSALTGQVVLIEPGQDHGFILTSTGSQLYFHRDSVTSGRFENLRPGEMVHYVEEAGDAGPVATKIRLASEGAQEAEAWPVSKAPTDLSSA